MNLINQIAAAPYVLNSNNLEQFYKRVTKNEEKLCDELKELPRIEALLPLLDYLKQGKAYEMIISKLNSAIYPVEHQLFNNADYVFLWQEASTTAKCKNLKKLELGTLYPRRTNNNPDIYHYEIALAEWKIKSVIVYSIIENFNKLPEIIPGETGTKDQMITAAYRNMYASVTLKEYAQALIPKPESFILVGGKYKRVKSVLSRSQIKFDCIIETYNDGIIQGFDWRVVNPNQYVRPQIELYCATCDRIDGLKGFDMFYVETKAPMCGPCRDHYMENNLIREDMIHR